MDVVYDGVHPELRLRSTIDHIQQDIYVFEWFIPKVQFVPLILNSSDAIYVSGNL